MVSSWYLQCGMDRGIGGARRGAGGGAGKHKADTLLSYETGWNKVAEFGKQHMQQGRQFSGWSRINSGHGSERQRRRGAANTERAAAMANFSLAGGHSASACHACRQG